MNHDEITRQRQIARDIEAAANGTAPKPPFYAALMAARERHHARLEGQRAFDNAVRPEVLQ